MSEKKVYYSLFGQEDVQEVPDRNLENFLKENYEFIEAFVPQGFKVAFLLQHDDQENSDNDRWEIVFFSKGKSTEGDITLDNFDDIEETEEDLNEYQEIKKIENLNLDDVITSFAEILDNKGSKVKEMVEKEPQMI